MKSFIRVNASHDFISGKASLAELEIQNKLKPIIQSSSLYYLKYTRQRQQAVLMLQHCAIMS